MTDLHLDHRPIWPCRPASVTARPDRCRLPRLFFAAEVDGKLTCGSPTLTSLSGRVKERLCWVCGEQLSCYASFASVWMCCVTRTTADPPVHYECAHYALKACPF